MTARSARKVLAEPPDSDAGENDASLLARLVSIGSAPFQAQLVDGSKWAELDHPNDVAPARFRFEPSSRGEVLDDAIGGHWNFDVTDFSFTRNHHFPTGAMTAAMRHALPAVMTSYASTQKVLNQKLAWHLSCDPERVQVLHGASQIYPILKRLVGTRPVLRPDPSFGEYERMFPRPGPIPTPSASTSRPSMRPSPATASS